MIKTRAPDTQPEEQSDEHVALESCAKDLISAIEAKDHKGVADALMAAFHIADTMPHEEGPHVEPHSYDAQNQEAAE